jgi:hypothetical protein
MRTLSPSVEDIISDEQLPGDKQSGQAQLGRAVEAITYLQYLSFSPGPRQEERFQAFKRAFWGDRVNGSALLDTRTRQIEQLREILSRQIQY